MDGENNGKPYSNGWFGGTTIFGNIHINLSPFPPLAPDVEGKNGDDTPYHGRQCETYPCSLSSNQGISTEGKTSCRLPKTGHFVPRFFFAVFLVGIFVFGHVTKSDMELFF